MRIGFFCGTLEWHTERVNGIKAEVFTWQCSSARLKCSASFEAIHQTLMNYSYEATTVSFDHAKGTKG